MRDRECTTNSVNRVMFPIMDINGKVIGFGGRVMGDAKPKYLNLSGNGSYVTKAKESVWLTYCTDFTEKIYTGMRGIYGCDLDASGQALRMRSPPLGRR